MFPTLNVMGHGSYLMGHGSHVRWVNGSWVNSNDQLPALCVSALCSLTGLRGGAPAANSFWVHLEPRKCV